MQLSIRKYALLRGCSEGNVRAAIKAGKIKEAVVRDGDKVKGIIVEVADKEWQEGYNTDRIRNAALFGSINGDGNVVEHNIQKQRTKPVKQEPSLSETTQDEQPDQEPDETDISFDSEENASISSSSSMTEAKRVEAILKARKLDLEIQEMKGRLIDADKVRKALFEFGSQVRESILRVPDLAIDKVIAAKSRNEAHLALTVELNMALENLSKNNLIL